MTTGTKVRITHAGRTVDGEVVAMTKFDTPGAVSFEAILGGYAGWMPIMTESDKSLTDLVKGEPVLVEEIL